MAHLIPWRFFDLDRFFSEDDWETPSLPALSIKEPRLNLYETDKDLIAEVEAPGFDPKDIEVSLENQNLYLKGKMAKKEEEKGKNYWRKEIRKESFERIVRLPVAVDENKVEAIFKNGILKIVMPKVKQEKEKKVKVEVKEE
ncbi:MAG: Hsp20/alpha crystallin family protein [Candidatus Paceibacterota bacterium]